MKGLSRCLLSAAPCYAGRPLTSAVTTGYRAARSVNRTLFRLGFCEDLDVSRVARVYCSYVATVTQLRAGARRRARSGPD
eukprot:scaffold947_cov375-Prasinococcus_capsulatus_cf.AAC.4